jgi:hypothetical protein
VVTVSLFLRDADVQARLSQRRSSSIGVRPLIDVDNYADVSGRLGSRRWPSTTDQLEVLVER